MDTIQNYGRFQFHSVGQGLFYTGIIGQGENEFIFVYDCGGEKKLIDAAVDAFKKSIGNRTINLLILSHLHEDHINGIEKLLDKIDQTSQIVMPYISKEMKILYKYHAHKNKKIVKGSFIDQFYSNPAIIAGGKASITYVCKSPLDLDDEEIENIKPIEVDEGNPLRPDTAYQVTKMDGSVLIVANGLNVNLKRNSFHWECNITQPFWDEKTCEKYKIILNGVNTVDDFNSELLHHLKRSTNHIHKSCLLAIHRFCFSDYHYCSVLSGDNQETKYRKISDALIDTERIFVFQIPHHGAKAKSSVKNAVFSVVSYGDGNSYGHPDCETLKQYSSKGSMVGRVNQQYPCKYNIFSKKPGKREYSIQLYSEGRIE